MIILTGLSLTSRHVENIFKQIQTNLSKKGFGYCMQQRLLKAGVNAEPVRTFTDVPRQIQDTMLFDVRRTLLYIGQAVPVSECPPRAPAKIKITYVVSSSRQNLVRQFACMCITWTYSRPSPRKLIICIIAFFDSYNDPMKLKPGTNLSGVIPL